MVAVRYFIEEFRMLIKNQPAPMFMAMNQDQHPISLVDFYGKRNVVLYFYPKDDTPGCTLEANDFSHLSEEFAKLDTIVIGVSKDSCASHAQFIEKYSLTVHLLADVNGELCDLYGVWQEREKAGIKRMSLVRSTFLIDKQGILRDVDYGVTPTGHARAVLEKIKAW
jgi:peroxiredoxin Q/BCP